MAIRIELDDDGALELQSGRWADALVGDVDARVTATVEQFRNEQAEPYDVLVAHWRAWTQSHLQAADLAACVEVAERIRQRFRAFVLVGIGGSDLGARTLHDCLDHPYHNQLDPKLRYGAPEIYFTGDTFDPRRLSALLDLLEGRGLLDQTCLNIVSKSGKTGETIAAAMVIRERMRGAGIADWATRVVATTGQDAGSVLYQMHQAEPFFGMLPVPEGVGGRFSFASPVGMLPLAVTAVNQTPGERVAAAMEGYASAHAQGLVGPAGRSNAAARLARWLHLSEALDRASSLVFYNYADDHRLGEWFTQLYCESVLERGGGLNVIPTRGPTGNHSLLNGILRGPRDKVVLVIRWDDFGDTTAVPTETGIGGDLEAFEGLSMAAVQNASCDSTVADFLDNGVPTAVLRVGARDEGHVAGLLRVLMDAVAIKGRLQNLHIASSGVPAAESDLTYLQEGVEGYKKRTREKAKTLRQAALADEATPEPPEDA